MCQLLITKLFDIPEYKQSHFKKKWAQLIHGLLVYQRKDLGYTTDADNEKGRAQRGPG